MKSSNSSKPDARGLRVGIVVSRYHPEITGALEQGARAAFLAAGGREQDLVVLAAPGAFELPVIASALARRADVAAVVVLGCIVQGSTRHDRVIADAVAGALAKLSAELCKPVGLGLLTVRTMKQAHARAGGKVGNKGTEAMDAALHAARAVEEARR
ncbi:MAG: 6,7-dimethyl-8-ribityllumazine synthase [Phycisphaerales bacterium]